MAESLNTSKSLRAGLVAAGRVDRWDHDMRRCSRGYSPADVRMHCVENGEWQKVRLSMKGIDTVDKLDILIAWWDKQMEEADRLQNHTTDLNEIKRGKALEWATQVQVGNYLGALRRGGQLDDQDRIRKAR